VNFSRDQRRHSTCGDAAVALAIKNAEAAFYRSVIASCVANNIPANSFREGLYNLTGQWK
jgi:hypothetical protein